MSAIVTEQKLLLLYFMDRCGTPLSSDQLTRHMLEQHWADYFQLQQMLLELGEARLVTRAEAFPRLYHLTDAGKETLALFNTQVPRYLKNQVNAFVRAHGQELAHETQVHAEYERIGSDEVMVTLEKLYRMVWDRG